MQRDTAIRRAASPPPLPNLTSKLARKLVDDTPPSKQLGADDMAQRTDRLRADDILEQAAHLFTLRGYSNTRMQDIAQSFGVTHAALYYHFKSKQEVLHRIHETAIRGLLAGLRAVIEADLPPSDRFEAALRAHIEFVAEHTIIVSALFDEERELSEDFSLWLRDQRREYTGTVEDTFRQGQKAGRLLAEVDPRYATNLLLGAGSWTYRWYRRGRHGEPAAFANDTVRLLVRGFLR